MSTKLEYMTLYTSPIKDDDIISKIGVSAWAVLTVIRSFCEIGTGKSVVSYSDLEQKTGLSRPSVAKAVKVLTEHNLITINTEVVETSTGKKTKKYYVIDKLIIPIGGDNKSDTPVEIKYVPKSFYDDRKEVVRAINDASYIITSNNINTVNISNCNNVNVVIVTASEELNDIIQRARDAQIKKEVKKLKR